MLHFRNIVVITIFVTNYFCDGIQVPTISRPAQSENVNSKYPLSFREPQEQLHTDTGYRVSIPKYKKPLNRVPLHQQEVDFSSVKQFNDAIRIVEPPIYFQEQKKHYQGKPPQRGTVKHLGNLPPSIPIISGKPYSSGSIRISPNIRPYALPVFDRDTSYRGSEYSPYPPKQAGHIRHSHSVQHPKLPPTYLGIQTPNPESIREQVSRLKEKQRAVFEDEQDEHPARKSKPKKKKSKKDVLKNSPHPFAAGYQIFNEGKEDFKKLKTSYQPANPYSVTEVTLKNAGHADSSDFVPYKMLASVRHTKRFSHRPRDSADPDAKENIKSRKVNTVHSEQAFEDNEYEHNDDARHGSRNSRRNKRAAPRPKQHLLSRTVHTVYSEQGYEDTEYDHGDLSRHADHKKKYRYTRQVGNKTRNHKIDQLKQLPVAIKLVDENGKNLSGQALLKHIALLVKNASKYLPDDSEESDPELDAIVLKPEDLEDLFKQSSNTNYEAVSRKHAYPGIVAFHQLDPSATPEYSAHNYAEKLKDFRVTPYSESGSFINCETEEPNLEQNNEKKKLGNLGSQLDCLKKTYFATKRIFSNPTYKQQKTAYNN